MAAQGCGGCPGVGPVERLLLWSARQVALVGLGCPRIDQAFHECLGARGTEVAVRFKSLLALTAASASRGITVGTPCRRCVTRDELNLLGIVDAAGCGDFALAHRILGGFAKPAHIDALTHAAEQVAEALAAAGVQVKARHLVRV